MSPEPTPEPPTRAPDGWLTEVTLEGTDAPVRVVLMGREGPKVIVRQADPADVDPEPIPMWNGDQVIVAQALSHMSLNTTDVVGDVTGFMFGLRIVDVRREPGKVFARTLRRDEADNGARVHVGPGEQVVFEPDAVTVELDFIDDLEEPTESGYVPLTPVFATWLSIGEEEPARVRYLLAAARRLDEANRQPIEVEQHRTALNTEGLAGPEIRRHVNALLGSVESAMIALGRAVDMVNKANTYLNAPQAVPSSVVAHTGAVTAIRNAYEHIEDRAVGNVRGRPNPSALTIFNYRRLLVENVIEYDTHTLSLTSDLSALIADVRQFFKDVAGNTHSGLAQAAKV